MSYVAHSNGHSFQSTIDHHEKLITVKIGGSNGMVDTLNSDTSEMVMLRRLNGIMSDYVSNQRDKMKKDLILDKRGTSS